MFTQRFRLLWRTCRCSPPSLPTVMAHTEVCVCVCVCVLVTQSYPTLCDPMDCSPSGSSVMRFSRQEYWSGLPFPFLGYLPDPGIEPRPPALWADCLLSEPSREPNNTEGSPCQTMTAKKCPPNLHGFGEPCSYAQTHSKG